MCVIDDILKVYHKNKKNDEFILDIEDHGITKENSDCYKIKQLYSYSIVKHNPYLTEAIFDYLVLNFTEKNILPIFNEIDINMISYIFCLDNGKTFQPR